MHCAKAVEKHTKRTECGACIQMRAFAFRKIRMSEMDKAKSEDLNLGRDRNRNKDPKNSVSSRLQVV